MKAIIQRVSSASVEVNNNIVGQIDKGFVVLLGVDVGDSKQSADILSDKISNLRIFSDENDKMNLSLKDVDGEVLAISNFTLCGDCTHGRRPYFGYAEKPDEAKKLYDYFCEKLLTDGISIVEKGVFGEDMKLSLLNNGPVTIILDTKDFIKKV